VHNHRAPCQGWYLDHCNDGEETKLKSSGKYRIELPLIALSLIAALSHAASAQKRPITAQQVIERVQGRVAVPWKTETVDTFKAGDPNTTITGVAVTMMATMDVLQRAAASGHNLIITHEPTFYSHEDDPKELPQHENDQVLAAKRKFIAEHRLVIWRFHDHWHARQPDGIETGMARALGWEKYQDAKNPYLFAIPEITLQELAAEIAQKLQIRTLRVVGKPEARIAKLALSPGASGFANETGALELPDVKLLILGETREWETVEYVADAISQGKEKALIILGHIPSEQAGMEECTRWIKGFVSEVPVNFLPARDPFWAPQP
jgi:putative NIF3 family GTP cyclohydrolase 1 type 2